MSGNRLPVSTLGAVEVGALLLAAALALRLLGVLARSVLRTLRVRRRHRALVDLVATPWPSLGGAHVLASPGAVAYCLPGLRPRVVVSRGTLDALDEEETAAVLAHERAHAVGRHDLVVLPFVALGATFPRLPSVRLAQRTVAFLVEALADDVARRSRSATALASALVRVGSAPVPGETLAVSGSPTAARVRRLLDPPAPVPVWLRALVWSSALGLVAVPTALLLLLPLVD